MACAPDAICYTFVSQGGKCDVFMKVWHEKRRYGTRHPVKPHRATRAARMRGKESVEKFRREDEIRTLMTMRIMESDGDVMLGTCRGPNSEEALSIPMMLLRRMTNCYTSVKLGGQTDVLLSVESGQFLARALF